MKKIFGIGLVLLTASFFFISCEKSAVAPAKKANVMASAENKAAIAKAFDKYFSQNDVAARASSNGAEHVVPYFTSESLGVVSYNPDAGTLTFADFTADLGSGDFFRRNPDGTYSVHVNSNTATASYFVLDFNTFSTTNELYGSGHLTANYTGELVEWPFTDEQGNILFVFRFVDTQGSRSAVSLHGNGNVSANGVAPWKNLSAKVIITPGSQSQVEIKLK
jgi:hypothetical protein